MPGQTARGSVFELGAWCFFGVWNLELVAWALSCSEIECARGTDSPPGEIDVRRHADPIVQFLWEPKVFNVAIAEEHVFITSAFVVVPDRPLVRGGTIGVPRPIALNNLRGWFSSDF